MDETIIEYIYWSEQGNNTSSQQTDESAGWLQVSSKDYDNVFNNYSFVNNYSDGITINKPLKLKYTIKYDVSGNPYNNLNIKNTNFLTLHH